MRSASAYLSTLNERLESLARNHERFDLCIYYAGMDSYERCHIGGLPGMQRALLAERERTVFAWCKGQGIPVAFGIGGGYINTGFQCAKLLDLHRLTLSSAVSELHRRVTAGSADRHFAPNFSVLPIFRFLKRISREREQCQMKEGSETASINY